MFFITHGFYDGIIVVSSGIVMPPSEVIIPGRRDSFYVAFSDGILRVLN